MKRFLLYIFFAFVPVSLFAEVREVLVGTVDGPINPAVQEYVERVIITGEHKGVELVIFIIDTPGGLDTSMRGIIKAIESSSVPIAVFVYPPGGRAASAGAIITLSAHISAMAPGTNIGAAHPVAMGGEKMDDEMMKKVLNDAVAFARSLAKKHGRNEEVAEKMVRESISLTAEEALKEKFIEFIANSPEDLLEKLDNYEVKTDSGKRVLHTKGARLIYLKMNLREKILDALSNPNIAYILLMIGIWGIFFELSHPGAILPGVIGAISLIIGLYSLHTLPVNFAGIALILLGLILFLAEIKITSYGLLGVSGGISILLGTIMLMRSTPPFYSVSLKIILPIFIFTILFFATLSYIAISAQFQKPTVGKEGLIGEDGVAITDIAPEGKVFVHGEYWDAIAETEIKKGEKIVVKEVDGLKLKVKKKEV